MIYVYLIASGCVLQLGHIHSHSIIAKSQRQDIDSLAVSTNSTIFDYCVTHGIISYLNRTKFNCFIWQRSVQARHCLLYDPLRFSYGIMRLTSPAKTRELPKAGMFRHKRFLLASRCYNVIGKNSFRICALIIKDVIKAAIPMKLSIGLKRVKC